jgi:hypothetical protein
MTVEEVREIEKNIDLLLVMFDQPDSDENRNKIVERISDELAKLKENTVFLSTNQTTTLYSTVH